MTKRWKKEERKIKEPNKDASKFLSLYASSTASAAHGAVRNTLKEGKTYAEKI
ncbi:dihydroxy-acid dehydratase [Sporolactobacillus inulinus]|uniref:Dihydroxy-acid dehydratase n=1 Tax=Sporolactobacillus inulinus TaxID=2078 RepID=A0A4Y1ZC26_9BACL|nr:dihydroxy-acid dehydratase [Sporolactobacillus inulinus]